ncbi:hypothetical protein HY634_01460 [Candidatus Uhrbacteria bacterium]|nr:hypothetical protein [Candidatus Uhrbacteria bacterium]
MTQLLRFALCATVIATGCGGSDPAGHENDSQRDGTVTNRTDGGTPGQADGQGTSGELCNGVECGADQACRERSPGDTLCASSNPLIDAMRLGLWTLSTAKGMAVEENRFILVTDPFDPDCVGSDPDPDAPINEPGDACIGLNGTLLILDEERVRRS